MDVTDAHSAEQWAASWTQHAMAQAHRYNYPRVFHAGNVRRFRRVADEQAGLASFCRMTPRWSHAAADHDAAAKLLRDIADRLEREPAP